MTLQRIGWEDLIGEIDRILGEVEQGATFVITSDGTPVATLEPLGVDQQQGVPCCDPGPTE
jgi:antitoxin (DNA-binding transcriptional repressor) of toxin-antitoxin stability system